MITEGQGRFTIGDETIEAAAGDAVVVPAHAWHSYVIPAMALFALSASMTVTISRPK